MAGNVDFEPPVVRVFPRSVDRAEMGLSAVDRMVAAILQELDERSPDEGIVCSRNLADAVIVPVRYVEQTVFAVGRLILCSVQLVTRWRAAFVPVIRLQRDGELILLA